MRAIVRSHWQRVLELGCLVTRTPYRPDATGDGRVTLHHVHGGSICERGFRRTFGRKSSDWLVVGLVARLHVGPGGIDGYPRPSVEEWERKYRKQAAMIDELCRRLNLNLWEMARREEKGMVAR